jgi:hypothetical protein
LDNHQFKAEGLAHRAWFRFADSAGRPCHPNRDLSHEIGLRNPQTAQTGLTEGLGTAFPQKGVPNLVQIAFCLRGGMVGVDV